MNEKTKRYIKRKHPYLDKNRKFLFFGNPKTALKSMTHGVLCNRIVMHNQKSHKKLYHEEIAAYTINDIEKMFKFTFIRNPWDRTVSAFFFIKQIWQTREWRKEFLIKNNETFEEFIINKLDVKGVQINEHFSHQHKSAAFNNTIFVDFIGTFENLINDWKYVATKIDVNPNLPHINSTDHTHYRNYYTQKTRQIIAKIYKKDIETFNYKF